MEVEGGEKGKRGGGGRGGGGKDVCMEGEGKGEKERVTS